MSDHRKMPACAFQGRQLTRQTAFQPPQASFYLALGQALLEVITLYPEQVVQAITKTVNKLIHEMKANPQYELISLLPNLITLLRSPEKDLKTRVAWLDGFLTSNHQQCATALQLLCRSFFAKKLPQQKDLFLHESAPLPQEVEELLDKFCAEFHVVCQFSRPEEVVQVFGPAERVPLFNLHEKSRGEFVLLHYQSLEELGRQNPQVSAFPFIAKNRKQATNQGEIVEVFAKYCLNQAESRADLLRVLNQEIERNPSIQTDSVARLLQQIEHNVPPRLPNAPLAGVPPPFQRPPLIQEQKQPQLIGGNIPQGNLGGVPNSVPQGKPSEAILSPFSRDGDFASKPGPGPPIQGRSSFPEQHPAGLNPSSNPPMNPFGYVQGSNPPPANPFGYAQASNPPPLPKALDFPQASNPPSLPKAPGFPQASNPPPTKLLGFPQGLNPPRQPESLPGIHNGPGLNLPGNSPVPPPHIQPLASSAQMHGGSNGIPPQFHIKPELSRNEVLVNRQPPMQIPAQGSHLPIQPPVIGGMPPQLSTAPLNPPTRLAGSQVPQQRRAESGTLCELCRQYKETEYFNSVQCSGHNICSICRAKEISRAINCPKCNREYSDFEMQVLQIAALDLGAEFSQDRSSFWCAACSKTKHQSLKSPCQNRCTLCVECLKSAGLVCRLCSSSVWVHCSVCNQLLYADDTQLGRCKHLMHSRCQPYQCGTCQPP